jgi:hypothetical protein
MAEKESFFEGFRRNFSATLRPEALPCGSEKESFFEGFKLRQHLLYDGSFLAELGHSFPPFHNYLFPQGSLGFV